MTYAKIFFFVLLNLNLAYSRTFNVAVVHTDDFSKSYFKKAPASVEQLQVLGDIVTHTLGRELGNNTKFQVVSSLKINAQDPWLKTFRNERNPSTLNKKYCDKINTATHIDYCLFIDYLDINAVKDHLKYLDKTPDVKSYSLGEAGFFDQSIVVFFEETNTTDQNLVTLIHEFSHTFGAFHVNTERTIMSDTLSEQIILKDIYFDPLNRKWLSTVLPYFSLTKKFEGLPIAIQNLYSELLWKAGSPLNPVSNFYLDKASRYFDVIGDRLGLFENICNAILSTANYDMPASQAGLIQSYLKLITAESQSIDVLSKIWRQVLLIKYNHPKEFKDFYKNFEILQKETGNAFDLSFLQNKAPYQYVAQMEIFNEILLTFEEDRSQFQALNRIARETNEQALERVNKKLNAFNKDNPRYKLCLLTYKTFLLYTLDKLPYSALPKFSTLLQNSL